MIFNGTFDPNKNRGRHKRSYLEISFSNWLAQNFPSIIYKCEHSFKRFDTVKTYFADFYFPNQNLIIELDGTQHKNTVEYDNERDKYIMDNYNVQIIRLSHQEYQSKSRINEIKLLLGGAE